MAELHRHTVSQPALVPHYYVVERFASRLVQDDGE